MINLIKPIILKKRSVNYKNFYHSSEEDQLQLIRGLENSKSSWTVPLALKAKVGKDRKLKDYFGDTVVFTLDEKEKDKLRLLQQRFLNLDIFAENLDFQFFHLTLHDLFNGKRKILLEKKVEKNKELVKIIFDHLREYLDKNPDHSVINMVPSYVYPAKNIALLIGYLPKTEKDYQILLNCYNLFEEINYLKKWPSFHVTLNYFQSRSIKTLEIMELVHELKAQKMLDFEISLNLKNLEYQHFHNMNSYQTIWKI